MLRKYFFCAFCAKSFCKMRNGSHGLTIHEFFFSSPSSREKQELSHLLKWTGFSENKELRERERDLRKTIILFYGDVKGCLRDISTKDSRAAWDELLAKIGEAGDAFWTRVIGEILNHICVKTDFWTLRYIQLFVQKFRNRKEILSYKIEDKFKIRNSKSLWV